MPQDIVVQTAQMCPVISHDDSQQHCLYSICPYTDHMTFSCQWIRCMTHNSQDLLSSGTNCCHPVVTSLYQAALLLNLFIAHNLWIFMFIFNHISKVPISISRCIVLGRQFFLIANTL